MNLTTLKEKIKKAQLEQDMYCMLRILPMEQQDCTKCTQNCPITGTQKCHIGCALFAAIG